MYGHKLYLLFDVRHHITNLFQLNETNLNKLNLV